MRNGLLLAAILVLGALPPSPIKADEPAPDSDAARYARSLANEEAPGILLLAAKRLAERHPDQLAWALDKLIKDRRTEVAGVLVDAAVATKLRHTRLLLAWAASELGEASELFLAKIDNDRPEESARAIEALAFVGDSSVVDRMLQIVRGQDEQVALQATRVLARLAGRSHAKDIVDATLAINNKHVREHMIWAVQDVLKSTGAAKKAFGRYARQESTPGYRAKDAIKLLDYADAPVEKYKVKFATIRKFFDPKNGVPEPQIVGSPEHVTRVRGIFEGLKKNYPGYYHLICSSVKKVQITDATWTIDHKQHTVNLRTCRLSRWNRDELFDYYLIQYGSIMFLKQLGDPGEGHRGWEQGVMDGWRYAIDGKKIAVDKDPNKYFKGVIQDPPWL